VSISYVPHSASLNYHTRLTLSFLSGQVRVVHRTEKRRAEACRVRPGNGGGRFG
jgi:hypothetical protein